MKLTTIGQALLIVAVLLGCAGIAEPSAGLAAATTLVTLVAFAIVVWRSHQAWTSGYLQAQMEMRPAPVDFDEPRLFKCGLDDCICKYDARFVEPQHD